MKNKLQVVILCGGLGTRLVEETEVKPKPMVKIGNLPIIVHIIKIFEYYGFNEFILAAGYKKEILIEYFKKNNFSSKIKIVDTGQNTMTGGRILRLKSILKNQKSFLLTYGDGVTNLDINELIKFHNTHKKIATVTAVHPPVRFGELEINHNLKVVNFEEKPQAKAGWINGGFFVLENKIFDYIKDDNTVFERDPLEILTKQEQFMAYKHHGYWQCMDTLRDKRLLNKLWNENKAPWKK